MAKISGWGGGGGTHTGRKEKLVNSMRIKQLVAVGAYTGLIFFPANFVVHIVCQSDALFVFFALSHS